MGGLSLVFVAIIVFMVLAAIFLQLWSTRNIATSIVISSGVGLVAALFVGQFALALSWGAVDRALVTAVIAGSIVFVFVFFLIEIVRALFSIGNSLRSK